MTTDEQNDDLSALWRQDPGAIDAPRVIAMVHASIRTRRKLDLLGIAFGFVALAFVGWIDLQGSIKPAGLLTGMVLVSLLLQFRKLFKRRSIPQEASLSPADLLRYAIRKARDALWMARSLYAGLPAGILAGYSAGGLFTSGNGPLDAPDWLIDTAVAGILALTAVCMLVGFVVAGRKKAEILELRARLKEIEETV